MLFDAQCSLKRIFKQNPHLIQVQINVTEREGKSKLEGSFAELHNFYASPAPV
jgi:hypothetical protein